MSGLFFGNESRGCRHGHLRDTDEFLNGFNLASESIGDVNSVLAQLTSNIVSAYVGYNPVPADELSNIIAEVHGALRSAAVEPTTAPSLVQLRIANTHGDTRDTRYEAAYLAS